MQYDKVTTRYSSCIWSMRQQIGVVSWTPHFRDVFIEGHYLLNITKNGTLIIESNRSSPFNITSIFSCNLKTMIHKDHGFGMPCGPEISGSVTAPSTVGTSFPESLIMYEGGKSVLKYAKSAIPASLLV